nr:SpaA isopeptide-forming pilin-related protein [Bifidobacterium miconis]
MPDECTKFNDAVNFCVKGKDGKGNDAWLNSTAMFARADGGWQFHVPDDYTYNGKKISVDNPLPSYIIGNWINGNSYDDKNLRVQTTVNGADHDYYLSYWDLDLSGYGNSQYQGSYTIYAKLPDDAVLPDGYTDHRVPIIVNLAKTENDEAALEKLLEKNRISTTQPANTKVNLFDYWLDKQDSKDYADSATVDDDGINVGHALKFRRSGFEDKNEKKYNQWTSYSGYPYRLNGANSQGMVQNTLDDSGYPKLNTAATAGTTDNGQQYAGADESLSYLFNPGEKSGSKASYTDVKNLFKVENGYYKFDSAENYAEYDHKENAFHVYNQGAVSSSNTINADGKRMTNFFPFNKASDVFTKDTTGKGITYDRSIEPYATGQPGRSGVFSDKVNINHYFGMTMETRFTQKYHGHTNSNENDTPTDNNNQVKYEFSGDDDVWVYVDGVLVADLGGIHNRDGFTINFATGDITVTNHQMDGQDPYNKPGTDTTFETSTLKQKFEDAGVDTSNFEGNTLPNNTSHTLKFFYLERGNTDSNCSLMFNLIDIPDNSVKKIDQYGNPVKGAGFKMYSAYSDYKIDSGQVPFAMGDTDANGVFGLTDPLTGDPRSLAALKTGGVTNILVKESKVPDGYRRAGWQNPHIKVVTKTVNGGDYTYLKSENENPYQSGSQVVTGLDVSVTGGGNKVTCGAAEQCDLTKGAMFAIVMKHKTNADGSDAGWYPVTGDTLNGWKIWDNPTQLMQTPSVIKRQIASRDATGNWHLKFDELPGDVEDYAFLGGGKYSINYYYTTDALDGGVINYTPIAATGLSRELSSTIYVSDIVNTLAVQKLDENGTPFKLTDKDGKDIPGNHAEFALYKDEDVAKNDDGKPTGVKDGGSAYATMTTRDYAKTSGDYFDKKSAVVFSGLTNGTYYVRETKAPTGYGLNSHWTKVVVNDNGVFADAGIANDNIKVQVGLGSVVKSLYPTVDGIIDKTLTNLTVGLKSADSTDMGDELNKENSLATAANNANANNTEGDQPNYLYGTNPDYTPSSEDGNCAKKNDDGLCTRFKDYSKGTEGTYAAAPPELKFGTMTLNGKSYKETPKAHYSHFPYYWAQQYGSLEKMMQSYGDYAYQDPDEAMSGRWESFLTGTGDEPHAMAVQTQGSDTVAHLSYHGLSSDAVFEYSPTRTKDANGQYIKNGKYDTNGTYVVNADNCTSDDSCEYELAYDKSDANYPDAFTADDDFSVDEGFPMLSVTQNYEDAQHGVSGADKQKLDNTELSGLFSGLTTIQVTDRGFSPLKISNVVVDLKDNTKKAGQDGTLPNPAPNAQFGFTITLKAGKGMSDVTDEYDYKLCTFDGTDPTQYNSQTCEPQTKTLSLKPVATTTGLWESIVRLFTARKAAAETNAYSGTLNLKDGQIAVFDELPETIDYTMTESSIPTPFYQKEVVAEDKDGTQVTPKSDDAISGNATGETKKDTNRHAHFVNTFGVEAQPGVIKKVTGMDWKGDKNFTFDLTRTTADGDAAKKVYRYKDGNKTTGVVEELSADGLTASTNGKIENGKTQSVNFPELVFNDTGTYTFKVAEETTDVPEGWKYDTTGISGTDKGRVTIKVAQEEGHEPTVTLTYGAGAGTGDKSTFVNSFATVTALPLTGGNAAARLWLGIGGVLLACCMAVYAAMNRKRAMAGMISAGGSRGLHGTRIARNMRDIVHDLRSRGTGKHSRTSR